MGISDRTKQLLADTLKKKTKTTPLRKITVSELCADCGLDRRTFYYHFRDIYDLTAWVFNQAIDTYLLGESGVPSISGLKEILGRMQEDASFYRRALAEDSQNALGRHILNYDIQIYDEALRRYLGSDVIPEEDCFAIRYHCFGALGMIRRWFFDGCTPPSTVMVERLAACMPPAMRRLYGLEPGDGQPTSAERTRR